MKINSYQSDVSNFINNLKTERPHLEESQQSGRALLWEGYKLDLDEIESSKVSKLAQRSYVYYRSPQAC